MNIAIIPARGGSKRIPRKNIKQFCGKPMIAWSIQAALNSECFEQVLVSTDDEEIAKVVRDLGAEVPFIRPNSLADDQTATIPVIAHAVQYINEQNIEPTYICCIYATAPFIWSTDILRGLELITGTSCDYSFSATSYPFPIQRSVRIKKNGMVEMFYPELFETRSQDLEDAYHDAGQFYWGQPESWLEGKPFFNSQSVPVLIPRYRVQDIDTLEDWQRAELMGQSILKNEQIH